MVRSESQVLHQAFMEYAKNIKPDNRKSTREKYSEVNTVVRPITGWTKRGDEYHIMGGKSYRKEDGCYTVSLSRVDGIHEIWKIPANDLSIEELPCRLEGPLEACRTGPFGRKFLEKYGKLVSQRRLPPKTRF